MSSNWSSSDCGEFGASCTGDLKAIVVTPSLLVMAPPGNVMTEPLSITAIDWGSTPIVPCASSSLMSGRVLTPVSPGAGLAARSHGGTDAPPARSG